MKKKSKWIVYSKSVVHSKVVHQCCTESNGYNMMAGLEYFNHKEHVKSCIGIFYEKPFLFYMFLDSGGGPKKT